MSVLWFIQTRLYDEMEESAHTGHNEFEAMSVGFVCSQFVKRSIASDKNNGNMHDQFESCSWYCTEWETYHDFYPIFQIQTVKRKKFSERTTIKALFMPEN